MLNRTEYNDVIVIHMSDAQIASGMTEADLYAQIILSFNAFYAKVRKIVKSVYALCFDELCDIENKYNDTCLWIRDECDGDCELFEVAYDDFSRSVDECEERWRSSGTLNSTQLSHLFDVTSYLQ